MKGEGDKAELQSGCAVLLTAWARQRGLNYHPVNVHEQSGTEVK